ncbi:MAG TPA: O-methyltransferase [Candidatus Paenibacillus intestinavium]|nr:O-methyltransferase [Candidatus Paenibacillus intestinavium]
MTGISLARQVDFVFRQLEHELTGASAGTVLIIVRNDTIGKFGIKHHPIHIQDNEVQTAGAGLTKEQVDRFRVLAIDALKMKRNWTHGEILYDFSVRSNRKGWSASVLYESNYNMSTWNVVPQSKRNGLIDYSS